MSDELEQGMTPDASDESAHEDVDLSPESDEDTYQSEASDDSSTVEEGTDRLVELQQKLEEAEKRIANGTKTYQQLQQYQQMVHQYEGVVQELQAAGVDLNEIIRMVRAGTGKDAPTGAANANPQLTPAQIAEYLDRRDLLRDWNFEKKQFFKSNPDLDNKFFKRHMDSIAAEIANDEITQYGRIVSTPDLVAKNAGRELLTMMDKMKTEGAKKATTSRQKVKGQGIVESGHARSKAANEPAKDMTEDEYMKYSADLQLGKMREHRNKFINRK